MYKDDRLAVNTRTALMMFWNNGYASEEQLTKAHALIKTLIPATVGYYYADDVVELMERTKS